MTSFPSELLSFAATLTSLNLSFNKLVALPATIAAFENLQTLDVRNNALSSLPNDIGRLVKLQDIVLAMNSFSILPPALAGLPKLTTIVASDNKLQVIDVGLLKSLPILNCLDLTNNSIDSVPNELGFLQTLKSLKLEGNAFKVPRPAILAQGTAAIMEYLRNRAV